MTLTIYIDNDHSFRVEMNHPGYNMKMIVILLIVSMIKKIAIVDAFNWILKLGAFLLYDGIKKRRELRHLTTSAPVLH